MIEVADDFTRSLAWSHGGLSVQRLGAMLGPAVFLLADGRQVSPLHIAPWFSEPESESLPGILRRLRGEWPCVPFGMETDRSAQNEWPASRSDGAVDSEPHGYGSNHLWQWGECSNSRVSMYIDYPEGHPISRLERSVSVKDGLVAIECELVVRVRQDCTLPIGLHPVFCLPRASGEMQLEVKASLGATYPGDVDSSSIFEPFQMVADWRKLKCRDGTTIDPSQLPLPHRTEDLLQLLNVPGEASLLHLGAGYRARLSWNPEHFPSLLLWFSNYGRSHAPWNGRHLALGVEPICSAFDLGTQVSSAPNPINAQGVATARTFRAGETFHTRYEVNVESL